MEGLDPSALGRLEPMLARARYADRAYDSEKHRNELRDKGIDPQIAERGTGHGSGLGTIRWVIERTIAWYHGMRRLRIRWERRDDIHEAFLGLAVHPLESWSAPEAQPRYGHQPASSNVLPSLGAVTSASTTRASAARQPKVTSSPLRRAGASPYSRTRTGPMSDSTTTCRQVPRKSEDMTRPAPIAWTSAGGDDSRAHTDTRSGRTATTAGPFGCSLLAILASKMALLSVWTFTRPDEISCSVTGTRFTSPTKPATKASSWTGVGRSWSR